jgi:hypothetical protein
MNDARQRIIAASALVEAIRPSRSSLPADPSKVDNEDQPIVHAWDKARAELRAACAAYMLAETGMATA